MTRRKSDLGRPRGLAEFEQLPKIASLADADRIVRYYSSPRSRVQLMIAMASRMRRSSWLRLLGMHWTNSGDNDSPRCMSLLRLLLPKQGPVLEMMDGQERAYFDSLGDTVVVYRGCCPHNRRGVCWSMSKDIATSFAGWDVASATAGHEPLLVTAVVARERILALKLGMNEEEVITFHAQRSYTEHLGSGEVT